MFSGTPEETVGVGELFVNFDVGEVLDELADIEWLARRTQLD